MKRLHRTDLYGWSQFDKDRNIDFNSVLWVRPEGNIVVDPLPLSPHDQEHLEQLGGAAWIVITNSDHIRDADAVKELTGAKLAGPVAERTEFSIPCDRWLDEGEELIQGLKILTFDGSKTPGELALLLDDKTLIVGDLIRAHEGGRLCILPDGKLADRSKAIASIRRLKEHEEIEAVLPGDGWPIFRDGHQALLELFSNL